MAKVFYEALLVRPILCQNNPISRKISKPRHAYKTLFCNFLYMHYTTNVTKSGYFPPFFQPGYHTFLRKKFKATIQNFGGDLIIEKLKFW